MSDPRETERGQEEQDELDRQRKQGDRDAAENDGSGGDEPGDKIRQAEPEEKAEKETTEDIDRAFD